MSVSISIPTPLRRYTDGLKRIEVDATTAQAAVEALAAAYPGLKTQLFDDAGELRRFVNLYVGETNARQIAENLADVELTDGAELTIIPAIAGGAPGAAR